VILRTLQMTEVGMSEWRFIILLADGLGCLVVASAWNLHVPPSSERKCIKSYTHPATPRSERDVNMRRLVSRLAASCGVIGFIR